VTPAMRLYRLVMRPRSPWVSYWELAVGAVRISYAPGKDAVRR